MSIVFICPECNETYMDEKIPDDNKCPECGGDLEFDECY